jgi:ribokinase
LARGRLIQVFGPAYLDRVLLVDRSLVAPGDAPVDQSVDGTWKFGSGLSLRDPEGSTLAIERPPGWPGPWGEVMLATRLGARPGGSAGSVRGVSWHDDLGGMGAGFAAALGGELTSALGSDTDPMSQSVSTLLERAGVVHRPLRVLDRPADWTLLLTSGPFGDKLPIGFRGCHASIGSIAEAARHCDLRVVASFPNRLAAEALRAPGANVRLFAPAMRNMTDRDEPVSRFAEAIDVLCCNRREWESLDDREQVAWQVSLLAVTDGPNGSVIRFTTPQGEAGNLEAPAFPRSHPPRDTNRAGEAFASTLIATMLDGGWTASPGVCEPSLVRQAVERASAAAALVLDKPRFGFPNAREVDAALRAGCVGEVQADDAGHVDPGYNAGRKPGAE